MAVTDTKNNISWQETLAGRRRANHTFSINSRISYSDVDIFVTRALEESVFPDSLNNTLLQSNLTRATTMKNAYSMLNYR